MSDIKRYDQELELSWEMPCKEFFRLIQEKTLSVFQTLKIQQKWLFKGKTDNGTVYSARIRSTRESYKRPKTAEECTDALFVHANKKYEYTVKYYLSNSERLEFNSAIRGEEYSKVFSLHASGKVVNKMRLLLSDKTPGMEWIVLTADILQGSGKVIIEIEFPSQELKKEFAPPSWAKPYFKEET